ncbi:MAG: sterol desaturase family protein [Myxococcaceae bacterium]|nr:sterol desaturase family protein [Myxococcaceae bacterium]
MEHPLSLVAMFVTLHVGRYLLTAGAAWGLLWGWRANPFTAARRIQHQRAGPGDLRREVLASLRTAVLFGVVFGLLSVGLPVVPLTTSGPIAVVEFGAWLLALLVVHDTYFYWSHRLAHHPAVFGWLHALHHQSRAPTPFAALAFGVADALVQVLWAVPLVRWAPVPSLVWFAFSFVAIAINVLGHCGVEPFPAWWRSHPVFKWLNFATMHDLHHQQVRGNYGLYSSAWDRWMGTLLPLPDVSSPPAPAAAPAAPDPSGT